MSIKYMDRVWDTEELKGGRLLVMLALADNANDAGEAWPHQKTVAKKARLDPRQARRVEESLAGDGYLIVGKKFVEGKVRRVYRLFPGEADKMSYSQKADKMSAGDKMSSRKSGQNVRQKRTFSVEKSGHFQHPKADIFNTIPSRARSESPIEPKTEPLGNGIMSLDASWAVCVQELALMLPAGMVPILEGSHIAAAGAVVDAAGKPTDLYRVVIASERAANGLGHFTHQAGPAIRRKLGSVMGKPVLIEIVAAAVEPAEAGIVSA